MFRLIFQNLRKRKFQVIANIILVATGMSMIFIAVLMYTGVRDGIEISEKRLGADFLVVPEGTKELLDDEELLFTGAPVCVYMPQRYAEEISSIDGVEETDVQFFAQTLNASCCSAATASRVIGIGESSVSIIKAWLPGADHISLSSQEVIVGCNIPGIGNKIMILDKEYRIAGRLEETGGTLDNSILMSIAEARDIVKDNANFKHFWDRYGDPKELISSVQIQAGPGKKEAVQQALKEMEGIDVIVEKDVYETMSGQLRTISFIVLILGALVVVIMAIQLTAEFSNFARTRKAEWGLMRALGANKGDLRLLIFGEAAFLVVSGGLAANAATFVWFKGILRQLEARHVFPFVMPGVKCVIVVGAAVFVFYLAVAFLASWYPMYKSSRLDLAVVMQKGDID